MKLVLDIAKKELKDISRDRRALFVSLLFPLILFPLLFGVLENAISSANRKKTETVVIAVRNGEKNLLTDFLEAQSRVRLVKTDNLSGELEKRNAHLSLDIEEETVRGEAGESFSGENEGIPAFRFRVILTSDNSRAASVSASAAAAELIAAFGRFYSSESGSSGEGAVKLVSATLLPENAGSSILLYSIVLPLLALTFSSISCTAVAADIGAGEKERQTIEPLLANPAPASAIAAGKLAAVAVMGIAGVFSFTAAVFLSYLVNPMFLGIEDPVFTFRAGHLALIVFKVLFLIIIFSSAELCLSIYAKSVKEAQIMFIPLLVVCMACGYAVTTIDPGPGVSFFMRHIPVFNSALLIRELASGVFSVSGAAVTFAWSTIYAAVVFRIMVSLFSDGKVILRC